MGLETSCGRQDRVARQRVVSTRGLHRHESSVASKESGQVQQRSWNGGAIDQGGQKCRQLATALLPDLPGQSRPTATLQSTDFLRQLALPKSVRQWSLTTLKEKLFKIGAKVTRHAKYITFELAEVAVPRQLFASLLERIGRLRQTPALCRSGKPLSLRRDGGGEYWRTRGNGFAPAAKKGWNPMLKTDQTPSPCTLGPRLLTGRRQVDIIWS